MIDKDLAKKKDYYCSSKFKFTVENLLQFEMESVGVNSFSSLNEIIVSFIKILTFQENSSVGILNCITNDHEVRSSWTYKSIPPY